MINFETDKIVIIYYKPYAGGKFLSNCLALSKSALPQNAIISLLDLNFYKQDEHITSIILKQIEKELEPWTGDSWPSLNDLYFKPNSFADEVLNHPRVKFLIWAYGKCLQTNQTYNDFKLESILKSLPPSKKEFSQWLDYDFGCTNFFGVEEQSRNNSYHDFFDYFLNSNKLFFKMSHDINYLKNLLKVWPNAKIIQLYNFSKFCNIAKPKADYKISNFEDFKILPNSITFNVDLNYFNKKRFLTSIEELYSNLGLDDFSVDRVEKFSSNYFDLHK